MNKANLQKGFSLLEILVAMAIMAILGGIMVGQFITKTDEAALQRIKGDLTVINSALLQYHMDNFLLPSNEQGLSALVSKPYNSPIPKNYKQSGYLVELKKDPWNNEYQYVYPGEHGQFDIYSLGRDGEVGGEGLDSDIGRWNIDEVISSL